DAPRRQASVKFVLGRIIVRVYILSELDQKLSIVNSQTFPPRPGEVGILAMREQELDQELSEFLIIECDQFCHVGTSRLLCLRPMEQKTELVRPDIYSEPKHIKPLDSEEFLQPYPARSSIWRNGPCPSNREGSI